MDDVIVIPHDEFLARAGEPISGHVAVLIEQPAAELTSVRLYVAEWVHGAVPRSMDAAGYIRDLARRLDEVGGIDPATRLPRTTIFQAEDMPIEADSVSWQGQARWRSVRLVPDLYYFREHGYARFLPEAPTWSSRRPAVVWRGRTTGDVALTRRSVDRLARYRLCRAAQALDRRADVLINGVVQAASPEEAAAIRNRLLLEGVMGPFLPLQEMVEYKLVADIDGNASSWNFMAKLRLGACVLRVESLWKQWFSDDLKPWEHYVPVAVDLSDFADKVEWCLSHDREAEAIAGRGRDFALAMHFDEEMLKAGRTVYQG